MCEPFVTASSRRSRLTSWGARPGAVGEEERICEMRIGRPVRVARMRRCARYLWPVNLRGGGDGVVAIVGDTGLESAGSFSAVAAVADCPQLPRYVSQQSFRRRLASLQSILLFQSPSNLTVSCNHPALDSQRKTSGRQIRRRSSQPRQRFTTQQQAVQ